MDHEELVALARSNNELLESIQRNLDARNEAPIPVAPAVAGVTDQAGPPVPSSRLLDIGTQLEMRRALRFRPNGELRSVEELHHAFAVQMRRGLGTGIPFETWAAQGGNRVGMEDAFRSAGIDPDIKNAIDTGAASALIRQDLEPFLYELYVRTFPAFDRFVKEPANGLTHTYNQITSFGAAQFMSELGTVTDDSSVYDRKTTNIAIVATRRGLSLKSQYAVAAGGMGYNPVDLELQGGLRAISAKMQRQIFSGQSSNSGGSASTEDGEYDANGFDGLRKILNTARAKNVNPLTGSPEDMREWIDRAVEEIVQAGGGVPSILWSNPGDKITFDLQQDKNVRYMNSFVDVAVGVQTNAVNTVAGPLPLAIVPGNSITNYTTQNADGSFNGGENVRDLYVLDESTISLPFLGSEGPTVLDIPIGISGQLTHLFILFGMWGLAVKAIPFSNKLRIKQS